MPSIFKLVFPAQRTKAGYAFILFVMCALIEYPAEASSLTADMPPLSDNLQSM
ncbi:hypothetical protein GA0071314_2587 [Halomonas sp. HL-93]|nr:hypothetical protein GA0071314_2587 [Halomonas sp. HL-93]